MHKAFFVENEIILVIEDNKLDRKLVKGLLQRKEYRVACALMPLFIAGPAYAGVPVQLDWNSVTWPSGRPGLIPSQEKRA